MNQALKEAIIAGTPGLSVTALAQDLREIIFEIYAAARLSAQQEAAATREKYTLSRQEAARALSISLNTLDRWAQEGILTPIRAGRKVLYRRSDIDAMLTGGGLKTKH